MDWGALLSTFGLIFVAELGDKTQLAVLTQTCKYRRPWAVFLGASMALTAVTLIGALGGQVLGQFIPPNVLRIVAGVAFVAMGVLVGREATKVKDDSALAEACACPVDRQVKGGSVFGWDWRAFGSTLGLLFVAELGDKTQLAVLSLASKYGAPWPVFLGGALALAAVTGLGAVGGQGLCSLIPQRVLLWISAVAFVVMGVLMVAGLI